MKTIAMMVVTAVFAVGPADSRKADVAKVARPLSAAAVTRGVAPALKADPADSVYRLAREALSRGDYNRATELFNRVVERYPSSSVAGEALYYAAFSMYRAGGTEKLKSAKDALARLATRYPEVSDKGDAKTLRTRVCGELAKRGDEGCAAELAEVVKSSGGAQPSGGAPRTAGSCPREGDEDDERIAALNALLQMDAERAMPILTKVLERRDACSAPLRRKAVFLVSQKRTPQTADLLLKLVRSDPDAEVREQAVFWLSQVSDERAVDMLQEILKTSRDENLQNKALFALSQHRSGRGAAILREFAGREGASDELRGQAIFWLGQRRSTENGEFLRGLYSRIRSDELKDKILFSLSQQRGVGNEKWLLDIATTSSEPLEIRKK
ncbi:MAG TPA: HEAT repeat domain-containing protein, partial [Gemmatimonadaceae bacterium]|nr:HEAT repeat domain-containing protein [Gemmatimonadaceae bacterium]